jgi:uncharacterized protein (TIGR03435 family)
MLKPILVVGAALAAAATAPAQSTGALAFEVASVKAATPGPWREPKVLDDRVDLGNVTLKYCIALAYGLKEYQVTVPAALANARYDILAKGPAGTKREQLPAMMQALLAERMKLQLHREKKEFDVYVLVVAKNGPKLEKSPEDTAGQGGARYAISMQNTVGKIEARRADMASLAGTLPRFVGRPVLDQTGVAGRYDFDLEFSPEDMKFAAPPQVDPSRPAGEFGVSIFTSIQRVGLRLESRKVPLDAIVVDSAEKTPVEN